MNSESNGAMGAQRTWSDEDLERYLDGELDDEQLGALCADLRAEPQLRSRLEAARKVDELLRAALDAPAADTDARAARGARRRRRWALRAAAAIALAALGGAGAWLAARNSGAGKTPEIARGDSRERPGGEGVATASGQPLFLETRTLLALPVRAPDHARAQTAAAQLEPVETANDNRIARAADARSTALEAALAQGDALRVIALLTQSERDADASAWRRLGEILLSADTAREALAGLPRAAQLRAIRIWADQPSLRPVVFTRLGELLEREESRESAAQLRDELAKRDDLLPWLSSYASLP